VAVVVARRRRERKERREARKVTTKKLMVSKAAAWALKSRTLASSAATARESARLQSHLKLDGGIVSRHSRPAIDDMIEAPRVSHMDRMAADAAQSQARGEEGAGEPQRAHRWARVGRRAHPVWPKVASHIPHNEGKWSRSLAKDMDTLVGAINTLAPDAPEHNGARGRKYSVLQARSCFNREERGLLLRMVLGWALNWLMLLCLLHLFIVYCCEFTVSSSADASLTLRELILAWAWSIGQKVFFNDPLIIVVIRGLPMLRRSKLCACLCSEGAVEYVGQVVESAGTVCKEFMR